MENNNIIGNSHQQPSQYSPLQPPEAPSSAAFNLLQQQQQQNQQLQLFWNYQRQEIASITDFKNHHLPLARIKKIMKADEDVRMISAEAPVLFSKACELFILELTIRSWLHAEENKRRTLQKNDIAAAIFRTDIFDFLVDIVPRDEALTPDSGLAVVPQVTGAMPFYFPPPPPETTTTVEMMIGNPPVDPSGMYAPSQAWRSVWQAAGGGEDETYGDGGEGGEVGNLDG